MKIIKKGQFSSVLWGLFMTLLLAGTAFGDEAAPAVTDSSAAPAQTEKVEPKVEKKVEKKGKRRTHKGKAKKEEKKEVAPSAESQPSTPDAQPAPESK